MGFELYQTFRDPALHAFIRPTDLGLLICI